MKNILRASAVSSTNVRPILIYYFYRINSMHQASQVRQHVTATPLPEESAANADTTFFRWFRAEWSETWLVNHLSKKQISTRS